MVVVYLPSGLQCVRLRCCRSSVSVDLQKTPPLGRNSSGARRRRGTASTGRSGRALEVLRKEHTGERKSLVPRQMVGKTLSFGKHSQVASASQQSPPADVAALSRTYIDNRGSLRGSLSKEGKPGHLLAHLKDLSGLPIDGLETL